MATLGSDRPLEVLVSGRLFVIPRQISNKYPFSRLADLAYKIPRGSHHILELNVNAFAAVLYYLQYGNLDGAHNLSSCILQNTFDALDIPAPCLNALDHNASYCHTSPNPTMNDNAAPPAYEEISHPITDIGMEDVSSADAKKPTTFGSTLPTQLALVREQRIMSLIHTYILPLVEEQGISGLYKTCCILVPSNISALESSSSEADMIVGFPGEENVRLIRLLGEQNNVEFWRQGAVVTELDTKLKEALLGKGHKLASVRAGPSVHHPSTSRLEQNCSSKPAGKSSWFRRRIESKGLLDDDPTSNIDGGWRAPEDAPQLESGEVTSKVTLEDICLRITTDLGLYDNRTGKAIVIRIHAAHQEL